jgi:hypothetical protein
MKGQKNVKTFSNKSNAVRAMSAFKEKNPQLFDGSELVEFQLVVNENKTASLRAVVANHVDQADIDAVAKIADIVAPTAGRAILTKVVDEAIANGSPVIEEVPAMPAPATAPSEIAVVAMTEGFSPSEAAMVAEGQDPFSDEKADMKADADFAKAEAKAAKKAKAEARKAELAASRKEVARVKEEAQKERAAKRAASKAEKGKVTKERRAAAKVAKESGEKGPSGLTAQCIDLACRKDGVSAKELFELTNWHGAPWKWNFQNPQGTGWCDKYGYGFEVLGDRKTGIRYHVIRKAA